MNRTFSAVGYEIVEKENLTDSEILLEVQEIVAKSGSSDSLIVCILSHGSEGWYKYFMSAVPFLRQLTKFGISLKVVDVFAEAS